jgi:hypothetical protein
MTNAYSQFEIMSWSWLHCGKLKVNVEHFSYGTLNSRKQENKTKDMS